MIVSVSSNIFINKSFLEFFLHLILSGRSLGIFARLLIISVRLCDFSERGFMFLGQFLVLQLFDSCHRGMVTGHSAPPGVS